MKNIFLVMAFFLACSSALAQFNFGEDPVDSGPADIETLIAIKAIPQYQAITGAMEFAIAIVLDIDSSGHLYANKQDGPIVGIPTTIKALSIDGVEFGSIIYPRGQDKKDINDSQYLGYFGQEIIFIPVKIIGDNIANPTNFIIEYDGLFCEDSTGSCLPWFGQIELKLDYTATLENSVMTDVNFQWPAINFDDEANEIILQPTTAIWILLLTALAAGFLLNLMPCVLPVIPLKVLSIIQQGQAARASGQKYQALKLSIMFAIGILVVFGGLGALMSALGLFYGQQFQNETFKFFMLMIVFVLSLSMMGLFEITLPAGLTSVNVVNKGYAGAFMMGVFATLLATPCSAPLLGPVLTWSLAQSASVTIATFLIIGVGMAFPYVLLTAFPKLIDKVPTAGQWMITLKVGLGFVMMGVAIYLLFLFRPENQQAIAAFCLVLAFAIWLAFSVVNFSTPKKKKIILRVIAVLTIALGGWAANAMIADESEIFTTQKLYDLLGNGNNVYVKFTAEWCPNCKYVESTVINRAAFRLKLQETNTVLLKADLTYENIPVSDFLFELGSRSIPFTAIFPAADPDNPIIIRDIYTLETALDALDKLGLAQ